MYVVYLDFRRVKFVDVKTSGSPSTCARVVNFPSSLTDVIMSKCVKHHFSTAETTPPILYFIFQQNFKPDFIKINYKHCKLDEEEFSEINFIFLFLMNLIAMVNISFETICFFIFLIGFGDQFILNQFRGNL